MNRDFIARALLAALLGAAACSAGPPAEAPGVREGGVRRPRRAATEPAEAAPGRARAENAPPAAGAEARPGRRDEPRMAGIAMLILGRYFQRDPDAELTRDHLLEALRRVDADGDGAVSRAEFEAELGRRGAPQLRGLDRYAALLSALDGDGDAALRVPEFTAFYDAQVEGAHAVRAGEVAGGTAGDRTAGGTGRSSDRRPSERPPELPAEYRQLLPRNGIPAVDDPQFATAANADLPDEAWVLGVDIRGEARAYSLNLLNRHEIVNDHFDGAPIAVVW